MKRFAAALFVLSIAAVVAACSSSRFSSDPSVDCGEPGASNDCRAQGQPRLVVAFGDATAKSFTYTAADNEGGTIENGDPCYLAKDRNPAVACDASFYTGSMATQITLTVGGGDGGSPLAMRVIDLTPFNYCGDGAANVVVTTASDGTPVIGNPTFVDLCSRDVVPY